MLCVIEVIYENKVCPPVIIAGFNVFMRTVMPNRSRSKQISQKHEHNNIDVNWNQPVQGKKIINSKDMNQLFYDKRLVFHERLQ